MHDRQNRNEWLEPLAPLLTRTLERRGLGRVVLLSRLQQHWPDIVGPQLAKVAQPEGVRSRVLFISVVEAVWLQQLKFYQSQVLQNMRRVLGDVPIHRLHCTLAVPPRTSRSSDVRPSEARPSEADPSPLPLTAEEERQVITGTDSIADPELRELVRRTWRKGWQVRRQKR
jgi:predicted nucleic acid-binding Zn ribbon protein